MKRILLVCLTAVLIFASGALWAQDLTVSGKITSSEDGSALPGVNVVVKGTTTGTVTDVGGNYSITAPANGTLVFTFIGLTSQEVPINNRTTVDVIMSQDVQQLSEVVVTALNIPREKASLGYATQTLGNESVAKVKQQNFVNSLSGKIAGVQIRTTGNFGSSTNIVIRGNKSVTGNNQPLFVVDGVPVDNRTGNDLYQRNGRYGFDYGNATSDINPEDIESINVLKGAAASALYGSRAANGVIMITTKKGQKREGVGISLSTGLTVGTINKDTFVEYQDQYGAGYAREWYHFYDDEGDGFLKDDVNGDGTDDFVVPVFEDGSYGAPFDPNLNVYHWDSFVPESPNYQKAYPWTAAKNTPVDFFETQMVWNNSVALSGGNDLNTFRLSYTNYDSKGFLPNQDQERHTVSFNGSSKINEQLTASLGVNYISQATVGRASTGYGGNQMANFRQWWQTNVDIKAQEDMFSKTGRNITWNPADYYDPEVPIFWDNPYWTRFKNFTTDERNRVYGNFSLSYQPLEWLNVLGRVSVDTYTELREERVAVGSIATEFGINKLDEASGYQRSDRNVADYNYDFIVTANKDLSPDFSFLAILGTSIRKSSFREVIASTQGGLVVPDLYALSNSKAELPLPVERDQKKEVYGYFTNLNLGWKDMLYLDLIGRIDVSSALPVNDNAYPYYGASLSYVFSEMFEVPFINYGKVRLNYAEVGNDTDPQRTTITYTKNSNFGDAVLFTYPTYVENPNLVPENLESLEAGLEMSMFDSRLGLDLAFYKTNAFDQIVEVELSKATGANFIYLNGGEIQNKGVEVALSYDIVKNNNFTWNASVNWAKNVSEVISLPEGIDNYQIGSYQGGVSSNATVGQPYGVLRGTGYQYLNGRRVISTTGAWPGLPVAVADQVIGDPNPDWNGGLMNAFNYKGIGLSFLIDVSHGGDVFSLDNYYGEATGIPKHTAGNNDLGNPIRDDLASGGGILFEGVLPDGSENNIRAAADAYRGAFYWGNATQNPAQMRVYDAGYVKLREVALTYTLPSTILPDVFRKASLSLVGNNLWIIDKSLPYADPESGLGAQNGQGYSSGAYPTLRTYGFRVDIDF
jgi:TonB-linked SusC/RagA family outer membrane protein